jgi:hypothetical protein
MVSRCVQQGRAGRPSILILRLHPVRNPEAAPGRALVRVRALVRGRGRTQAAQAGARAQGGRARRRMRTEGEGAGEGALGERTATARGPPGRGRVQN